MTDVIEPLILDLLEWVGREERTYAEALDAWRTSCPRLPVWEEAADRGLITKQVSEGRGTLLKLTPSGTALLKSNRRTGSGGGTSKMGDAHSFRANFEC